VVAEHYKDRSCYRCDGAVCQDERD
jgi:hypothetical protein